MNSIISQELYLFSITFTFLKNLIKYHLYLQQIKRVLVTSNTLL